MTRRFSFLIVAVGLLAFGSGALARSYTPNLGAFYQKDATGNWFVDQTAFKRYAGELGVAMAPKFLGPASTLWSMGFEVSFDLCLTDVNLNNYYWKGNPATPSPGAAQDPGSLLMTNQIRLRKGLPYSLQVGGVITHLYQSDLWGIGLELGWALHEGFRWFPDVAFTGSINTILGSGDLAMLEVGAAAVLSKSFSVAGLFTITPFAGYNMVFVNASSHVTGTYVDAGGATQELRPFVIGQENVFRHRAIVGLNFVVTYVTFGTEVGIAPGQRSYAFKLGTAF